MGRISVTGRHESMILKQWVAVKVAVGQSAVPVRPLCLDRVQTIVTVVTTE
jgi:hypothetical protein